MNRLIKWGGVALSTGLLLPSCICQVQTAHVISLHGKECEGLILPLSEGDVPEFYHAEGKNYVKAIHTRLEPFNRELAFYQWPNMIEYYRPVPGAEQRIVYLRLPEGFTKPCADNWTETLPAGAQPGVYSKTPEVVLYACLHFQYGIMEQEGKKISSAVLLTSCLEDNARSWFTKPLAVTSFVVVDIPATIISSAVGAVYTLLSPSQSFTMQVDYHSTIALPMSENSAQ